MYLLYPDPVQSIPEKEFPISLYLTYRYGTGVTTLPSLIPHIADARRKVRRAGLGYLAGLLGY